MKRMQSSLHARRVRADQGERLARLILVTVVGLMQAVSCTPSVEQPSHGGPQTDTTSPGGKSGNVKASAGRLPPDVHASAGEAFFEIDTILGDRFVFKLTDPARIREAREILEKKLPKRVSGRVVTAPQPYNRPWHFHLDPATVEFSYLTDDRCDAAIHYLEDHIAEIGKRVLPDAQWCPLSSRLVRELFPAQ